MRAVLWCNGKTPSKEVMESVISPGTPVFGVDGGADKASEAGVVVDGVLGDLDSCDRESWQDKAVEIYDQTKSDLAKSISYLVEAGYDQIEIIGADGGSHQHILGNWGALVESPKGPRLRIHHENSISRRLDPGEIFKMRFGKGEVFSIFSFCPGRAWVSGARWSLSGDEISFSTRGLHNEGTGEEVSVEAEVVIVIIYPRVHSSS